MGYYTDYEITVSRGTEVGRKAVGNILCNVFGVDYIGDDVYFMSAKWYEYESDLRALTELYPDVRIDVEGYGDDRMDMWRATFENGVFDHRDARIDFPDYNPTRVINTRGIEFERHVREAKERIRAKMPSATVSGGVSAGAADVSHKAILDLLYSHSP